MIINIRGTGGSGKSTLVRKVMACYPTVEPMHDLGRKRPIGYKCSRPGAPMLTVVGHYETACGGCDTITSPEHAYQIVRMGMERGDVLFEGIIIQDDVKRLVALVDEARTVKVIALEVPIEVCLAGIQSRRDARGDERPLNPKNTVHRAERLVSIIKRLQRHGVDATWYSRDGAWAELKSLLGIGEPDVPSVGGGPAVENEGPAAGQEAGSQQALPDLDRG